MPPVRTGCGRRVSELAKRIPVNRTPAQVAGRMSVAAVRRRLAFPLLAPHHASWRRGATPSPARYGANYDTEWARRYPARVARLLLLEGAVTPG